MRFRKLRIAFSAVCGIICLLLIVLCVRSYWQYDTVWWLESNWTACEISSNGGLLYFMRGAVMSKATARWGTSHHPAYDAKGPYGDFHFDASSQSVWLLVPYWCLIAIGILSAAVPWLPWRFSLRTLLIAVTLTAVILGAIVIAATK